LSDATARDRSTPTRRSFVVRIDHNLFAPESGATATARRHASVATARRERVGRSARIDHNLFALAVLVAKEKLRAIIGEKLGQTNPYINKYRTTK
jgi:hypothetical protein